MGDPFAQVLGVRRGSRDYLERRRQDVADLASWLEGTSDPRAMNESIVLGDDFWPAYDAIIRKDFAGRMDDINEADGPSWRICRNIFHLPEVSDLQTAVRGACRALILSDVLGHEVTGPLLAPLNALRAQDGLPLFVA